MVMLEAKFKPTINGVRKEIAACDNSDNATLIEVLVKANLVAYMKRLAVTKRMEVSQKK